MARINVGGYLDLEEDSRSAVLSLKFWPSPSIVYPSQLKVHQIKVPLNETAYQNLKKELSGKKAGERMIIKSDLEASLSLDI